MDFFVKDDDGTIYGPFSKNEMIKLAEDCEIYANTQVRNSLLAQYKDAKKYDFLENVVQNPPLTPEELAQQELENQKDKKKKKKNNVPAPDAMPMTTSFQNKLIPQDSPVMRRVGAGLMDFALIFAVMAIFAFLSAWALLSSVVEEKCQPTDAYLAAKEMAVKAALSNAEIPEAREGDSAERLKQLEDMRKKTIEGAKVPKSYKTYSISREDRGIVITRWDGVCKIIERSTAALNGAFLLFMGLLTFAVAMPFSLGYYGQTFGMWYFGVFLAGEEPDDEVGYVRSCIYACCVPFFAITSPLAVFFTKRSILDRIMNTRIINVDSKKS